MLFSFAWGNAGSGPPFQMEQGTQVTTEATDLPSSETQGQSVGARVGRKFSCTGVVEDSVPPFLPSRLTAPGSPRMQIYRLVVRQPTGSSLVFLSNPPKQVACSRLRDGGGKSCVSYFRFARFNTFPLYYLRAWPGY